MSTENLQVIPSSFRDPSGFVFLKNKILYRRIDYRYQDHYDLLISSGLYEDLTEAGFMVAHSEAAKSLSPSSYKVIRPEYIPFISYPYEWSFSQLKDAALLTLKIQKSALKRGMSLKDASAYNIQFRSGKPILIDTLSLEKYQEGTPWVAYRQFCQHFLAPLALIAKVDLQLGTLSQNYLDGIPLDLAARLLPRRTKFSLGLGTHLHLHARSQQAHANTPQNSKQYKLSKDRLLALLDNLESTVRSLQLPKQKTVWQDYYDNTNYTKQAHFEKKKIIEKWIDLLEPESVWDAGANDGTFSRIASEKNIPTLATDIDPLAIEQAYQGVKKRQDQYLLPLIINLTNPSPSIGWANQERTSFFERGRNDLTLCLAFVHHLAISNNLPFSHIAALFSRQSRYLIIEFVPKKDSNTQRLLAAREDIFDNYRQDIFEKDFSRYFNIRERIAIPESARLLYLMEVK